MKTPLQEIEEWTGHKNPDPSPWGGLAAFVLLVLVVVVGVLLCSCTQLNAIPFKVTVNSPIGGNIVFDKPAVVIPTK